MKLPKFDLAACPIDFVCCTETPVCVWAGWGFATWIVFMVTIGVIGTALVRPQQ